MEAFKIFADGFEPRRDQGHKSDAVEDEMRLYRMGKETLTGDERNIRLN